MAKGKLEYALYCCFDHTTMEQHFEKMAGKGWALDRMGIFWHYHRTAPRHIHYAVGYFPGGGIYAPYSGEELTFEEYCQTAGWELAAEYRELKIFCNEREDPVPLETQADVQVENIRRGSRKMRVTNSILGILGSLVFLWFLISLAADGAGTLASGIGLIWAVCGFSMGLYALAEFLSYRRWYRRASANARRDLSFTPTSSPLWIMELAVLLPLAALAAYGLSHKNIWIVLLLMVYGLVFYLMDRIRNRLRHEGKRTGVNLAMNLLVAFFLFFLFFQGMSYFYLSQTGQKDYQETHGFRWEKAALPLSLAELGVDFDPAVYTSRGPEGSYMSRYSSKNSLALAQMSAEEFYREQEESPGKEPAAIEEEYLQYVVTKSRWAPFCTFARAAMKRTYQGEEEWQSAAGWEDRNGSQIKAWKTFACWEDKKIFRYLLCLEDRTLKVDLSFEPDQAQREKILEKLGEI